MRTSGATPHRGPSGMSRKNEIRLYKAVWVMLVLSVIAVVLYVLHSSDATIKQNYELTQCNQGMLVAAISHVRLEEKLEHCDPDIRSALEKAK